MLAFTLIHLLTTAQVDGCRAADVMITLDVSGTMVQTVNGKTKYTRAKEAIGAVLTDHQAEGAFGLYLFPEPAVILANGTVKAHTGYCNMASELAVGMAENNKTAIMNKLNAITPSGKNDTPIYQALFEIGKNERYPNAASRRRAAILITDGMQDCCRGPFPDTPNDANDCYAGSTTLDTDEAFNNRVATIRLAYQLKEAGMDVWVVGFGDKTDPFMLAGIGRAFGTGPVPSDCDGSLAKANNCFYNIDAGNTAALTEALNAIVQKIQTETCNGIDDDCDGVIDEDTASACKNNCNSTGVQQCVGGEYGQCSTPAVTEVCNGVDDDCDGNIDKIPCTTQCHTPGFFECNGNTMGTICVSTVPVNAEEICNGVDDDCDGQIDEVGCDCKAGEKVACVISAECPGEKTCTYGKLSTCMPTKSEPEVCNGKDDDCDGKIDVGPDLCPTGSRCVDGECTSGNTLKEVPADPTPADLEKYRGSGFIKGCNALGLPAWLFLAVLPLVRRRVRRN